MEHFCQTGPEAHQFPLEAADGDLQLRAERGGVRLMATLMAPHGTPPPQSGVYNLVKRLCLKAAAG